MRTGTRIIYYRYLFTIVSMMWWWASASFIVPSRMMIPNWKYSTFSM